MIFPNTIQIETTAACNAHCSFCPHASMKATGRMSDELFGKIIREIGAWDRPVQICPFLTNEPFADPRLFEFMNAINAAIPKSCQMIFTNASLIDEKRLAKLLTTERIESVHCSLHHTNADAYVKDLGIPFDRTVENIKRMVESKPPFPVYVLRVSDGDMGHDLDFCQFCERTFPEAKPYVAQRWNWKGDIPSTYAPVIDMICPRHSSLCILHTGKVALCCLDQNADYCLGDANTQTLLEVFNGAIRAKFANTTKRNNVPCDRCNMR